MFMQAFACICDANNFIKTCFNIILRYTLTINYTDKNRHPKLANVLNLGIDKMFVYQSRYNKGNNSVSVTHRYYQL